MKREIYDEDHEAFRASVRQFLDREVTPHLETYAANHGLDRDFWLAAGKQGFLGLEIPEEYGGSEAGDYRFNAVLTEELAKVNMTLPSCLGIHGDIVAPYLVHLTNDEQKARWLPPFCTGERPGSGSDRLLADDRAEAVVLQHPGTAELLGNRESDDARLAGGEQRLPVDLAVTIPLLALLGRRVPLHEHPDDVAERLVVLVVDVALHVRPALLSASVAGPVLAVRCGRVAARDSRTRERTEAEPLWHRIPGSAVLGTAVVGCRNLRAQDYWR